MYISHIHVHGYGTQRQTLLILLLHNKVWFLQQKYSFHPSLSQNSILYCGGIMVKAMDCRFIVSDFVLQSHYYVHFQTNTLGKGMNPLILPAMA